MNTYLIKIDGYYYTGESKESSGAAIPSHAWYCARKDSSVLTFSKNRSNALKIEGAINLNSHWNRIYSAIRFDNLKLNKLIIEVID